MDLKNSCSALVRLSLIGLTLSLPACATYHARTPNPATVRGATVRRSLYYWDIFEVSEIEGKPAGMRFWVSSPFKVDAGQRMVVFSHLGKRGLFSNEVSGGFLPVLANFREGRRYQVTGTGTDGMARAWICDMDTGEVVSEVTERSLRLAPMATPVYVPIMVPSR